MNESTFRDHVRRLKEAVRGQDIAARVGLTGRGKRFFCPICQPAGGMTRFLNTAGRVPCLWNHDAIIGAFRGKKVVLVLDADDAGRKGTRDIASRFVRAGYPAPLQWELEEGQDLNELVQGMRKGGK